jgi:DNA-binding transcriptional LysR family regulator
MQPDGMDSDGAEEALAARAPDCMLQGERLVSLSSTDDLTIALKAMLLESDIEAGFAIGTTSLITVCAMVASGKGNGVVTPFVAGTFAEKVLIKPLVPTIGKTVSMATSAQTAPSLPPALG